MAMSGESFILSAKKGFLLDLGYMEELYYIREVFWFTLFMVKLLVTILSLVIFWLISSSDHPEFHFGFTFPFIFTALFSMLICFSTTGLFNHVEVAIIVAMCVDWDLHGKDKTKENANRIQNQMFKIMQMTLVADQLDPLGGY